MIRNARMSDIMGIMEIVKETIEEMHFNNNYQWDENYPLIEHFTKDIEANTLYVFEEEIVVGFVCINKEEPLEYKGLKWGVNEEAYTIHRLAVRKDYRSKGIAAKLLKFADTLSMENKIRYIKTDTYSLNTKAQNLLIKSGYTFIGEMSFLGKEKLFCCYEKILK
jgi:ribosomal protein S18 acetylase RimI-like enzyme